MINLPKISYFDDFFFFFQQSSLEIAAFFSHQFLGKSQGDSGINKIKAIHI